MYSDFSSAQPYVNDQFRVGKHYLFIKKGAVIRLDSITALQGAYAKSRGGD